MAAAYLSVRLFTSSACMSLQWNITTWSIKTNVYVCTYVFLKMYPDIHRVDSLKYQIIQIWQFLLNTTNKIYPNALRHWENVYSYSELRNVVFLCAVNTTIFRGMCVLSQAVISASTSFKFNLLITTLKTIVSKYYGVLDNYPNGFD